MKAVQKITLYFFIAGLLAACNLQAASSLDDKKDTKADRSGKLEKPKKKKLKSEKRGLKDKKPISKKLSDPTDAKTSPTFLYGISKDDLCDMLSKSPGLIHKDKRSPWIQSFNVGGRFHYQVAHVVGTDEKGIDFSNHYTDVRRLRLESKTSFLRFFTTEINVNLVDDQRFRDSPSSELDWGYDTFDEASLQFNLGDAFGSGWFDEINMKYGRFKMKITEEVHMSSNDILTIERSLLADKLGGNQTRPTGFTLELEKRNWNLTTGIFSGEDDADFLGAWNDGHYYYSSLQWQLTKEFKVLLDYTQNHMSGADDALGYSWATALSAVYEEKTWGIMGEAVDGDNGGGISAPISRRQGDFYGFVVSPWYWVIKDKLQVVAQLQHVRSEKSQGLQVSSRYLRGKQGNRKIDIDTGRGSEFSSLYTGVNYHICKSGMKIMGGVSFDELTTRKSSVDAMSYQLAFRASF